MKLKMIEEACQNRIKHSYENAFSEAIMNFFYAVVGESRTHIQNNELGDIVEELNYPDEYHLDLKEYASWRGQMAA